MGERGIPVESLAPSLGQRATAGVKSRDSKREGRSSAFSLLEKATVMTSRLIASLSTVVGIVAVCVFSGAALSGQSRATPPGLVVTALGGQPVEYKSPRTPWGDPDLQGVWSSDDLENVPMSRPPQFKELYLDETQFAARQ